MCVYRCVCEVFAQTCVCTGMYVYMCVQMRVRCARTCVYKCAQVCACVHACVKCAHTCVSTGVCVHVCVHSMCVCVSVYRYIQVFVQVCVCVCMYAGMCVYRYICVYTGVCMCACVCIQVFVCVQMCVSLCVSVYRCVWVCTCVIWVWEDNSGQYFSGIVHFFVSLLFQMKKSVMCMCVSICVSTTHECVCPWRPEEGVRSPGVWVSHSVSHQTCVLGARCGCSARVSHTLSSWAVSPAQPRFLWQGFWML